MSSFRSKSSHSSSCRISHSQRSVEISKAILSIVCLWTSKSLLKLSTEWRRGVRRREPVERVLTLSNGWPLPGGHMKLVLSIDMMDESDDWLPDRLLLLLSVFKCSLLLVESASLKFTPRWLLSWLLEPPEWFEQRSLLELPKNRNIKMAACSFKLFILRIDECLGAQLTKQGVRGNISEQRFLEKKKEWLSSFCFQYFLSYFTRGEVMRTSSQHWSWKQGSTTNYMGPTTYCRIKPLVS